MARRIALAYSGGLDTTTMVPWLREHVGGEIIAVVADVGQDPAELAGVEDKAIASGATACHVLDLKRSFVEDYVFPTLLTGAVYEDRYLLGTAIARPLIARAQVEIARATGADAVAHGCTGKGNDQVRFESAYAALAPDLEVIAPWRHWSFRSREDCLNYIHAQGIAYDGAASKLYSRDANLWHISHEGGSLEDPACPPPDDIWMLTASPAEAPDTPQDVTIDFVRGRPVAVDGVAMAPDAMLGHLNRIAGVHGVGRADIVENRLVGMKSRGCYETPGGTVLLEALHGLESLVHDRDTAAFRRSLGERFAMAVYDGKWFTPVREAISGVAESIAETMEGSVTVRLFKGTAATVARTSKHSLYAEAFATFGADEVYDQSHAGGFIRLHSLPSRIRAMRDAAAAEHEASATASPAEPAVATS
ncbi:MAG: argininosuccinate synthase [Planctomycetota bacterium]|jgi:argininosuccinate synthase